MKKSRSLIGMAVASALCSYAAVANAGFFDRFQSATSAPREAMNPYEVITPFSPHETDSAPLRPAHAASAGQPALTEMSGTTVAPEATAPRDASRQHMTDVQEPRKRLFQRSVRAAE